MDHPSFIRCHIPIEASSGYPQVAITLLCFIYSFHRSPCPDRTPITSPICRLPHLLD